MAIESETSLEKSISEFPNHPLFKELEWFRGTLDLKHFVLSYIDLTAEKTEAELKSSGVMAPWRRGEKIKVELIRAVREYVSLIRRVSELVCEKTSTQFDEKELRIIQARTVFDFETWLARVMFVIDAAPEKILEFSELLGQIETTVLLEDGFVAELNYVNKRGTDLDCTAIRRDFPFVGKAATTPRCAQSCESCTLE